MFLFGVATGIELKYARQPRVEGRDGPRNEARLAQAAERSKRRYARCGSRIGKLGEAGAPEALFCCCPRLPILDQSRQRMGIAFRRQKNAGRSALPRPAALADLQGLIDPPHPANEELRAARRSSTEWCRPLIGKFRLTPKRPRSQATARKELGRRRAVFCQPQRKQRGCWWPGGSNGRNATAASNSGYSRGENRTAAFGSRE